MTKRLTMAEFELEKARHTAQAIDLIFGALTGAGVDRPKLETLYEQDVTCPRCGSRELRATRDPKAPGEVFAICNKCTEG